MNQRFSLNVNGTTHAVEADPDMPLLYALRNDLGLNNPHFGCGSPADSRHPMLPDQLWDQAPRRPQ